MLKDKKARIIEAAVEVFCQQGFEKAKISDITQRAGIAQGTFYLYFPSKHALMPSIAEKTVVKLLAEIQARVRPQGQLAAELAQIIAIVFKFIEDYKVIYAFLYTGLSQSQHLKEWETIYQPFYTWLSNFLAGYQKSKKITSALTSAQLAKLVITLIEATGEQVYLYSAVSAEYIEQEQKTMLVFLLAALQGKD